MSSLRLWHRQELDKLKHDMDELYDSLIQDFCSPVDLRLLQASPKIQLQHQPEAIVVTAPMPSLNPDTINITIRGQYLTIAGEKTNQVNRQGGQVISQQKFSTMVRLPALVNPEGITAQYLKGHLQIFLPKIKTITAVHIVVDQLNHEEGNHE